MTTINLVATPSVSICFAFNEQDRLVELETTLPEYCEYSFNNSNNYTTYNKNEYSESSAASATSSSGGKQLNTATTKNQCYVPLGKAIAYANRVHRVAHRKFSRCCIFRDLLSSENSSNPGFFIKQDNSASSSNYLPVGELYIHLEKSPFSENCYRSNSNNNSSSTSTFSPPSSGGVVKMSPYFTEMASTKRNGTSQQQSVHFRNPEHYHEASFFSDIVIVEAPRFLFQYSSHQQKEIEDEDDEMTTTNANMMKSFQKLLGVFSPTTNCIIFVPNRGLSMTISSLPRETLEKIYLLHKQLCAKFSGSKFRQIKILHHFSELNTQFLMNFSVFPILVKRAKLCCSPLFHAAMFGTRKLSEEEIFDVAFETYFGKKKNSTKRIIDVVRDHVAKRSTEEKNNNNNLVSNNKESSSSSPNKEKEKQPTENQISFLKSKIVELRKTQLVYSKRRKIFPNTTHLSVMNVEPIKGDDLSRQKLYPNIDFVTCSSQLSLFVIDKLQHSEFVVLVLSKQQQEEEKDENNDNNDNNNSNDDDNDNGGGCILFPYQTVRFNGNQTARIQSLRMADVGFSATDYYPSKSFMRRRGGGGGYSVCQTITRSLFLSRPICSGSVARIVLSGVGGNNRNVVVNLKPGSLIQVDVLNQNHGFVVTPVIPRNFFENHFQQQKQQQEFDEDEEDRAALTIPLQLQREPKKTCSFCEPISITVENFVEENQIQQFNSKFLKNIYLSNISESSSASASSNQNENQNHHHVYLRGLCCNNFASTFRGIAHCDILVTFDVVSISSTTTKTIQNTKFQLFFLDCFDTNTNSSYFNHHLLMPSSNNNNNNNYEVTIRIDLKENEFLSPASDETGTFELVGRVGNQITEFDVIEDFFSPSSSCSSSSGCLGVGIFSELTNRVLERYGIYNNNNNNKNSESNNNSDNGNNNDDTSSLYNLQWKNNKYGRYNVVNSRLLTVSLRRIAAVAAVFNFSSLLYSSSCSNNSQHHAVSFLPQNCSLYEQQHANGKDFKNFILRLGSFLEGIVLSDGLLLSNQRMEPMRTHIPSIFEAFCLSVVSYHGEINAPIFLYNYHRNNKTEEEETEEEIQTKIIYKIAQELIHLPLRVQRLMLPPSSTTAAVTAAATTTTTTQQQQQQIISPFVPENSTNIRIPNGQTSFFTGCSPEFVSLEKQHNELLLLGRLPLSVFPSSSSENENENMNTMFVQLLDLDARIKFPTPRHGVYSPTELKYSGSVIVQAAKCKNVELLFKSMDVLIEKLLSVLFQQQKNQSNNNNNNKTNSNSNSYPLIADISADPNFLGNFKTNFSPLWSNAIDIINSSIASMISLSTSNVSLSSFSTGNPNAQYMSRHQPFVKFQYPFCVELPQEFHQVLLKAGMICNAAENAFLMLNNNNNQPKTNFSLLKFPDVETYCDYKMRNCLRKCLARYTQTPVMLTAFAGRIFDVEKELEERRKKSSSSSAATAAAASTTNTTTTTTTKSEENVPMLPIVSAAIYLELVTLLFDSTNNKLCWDCCFIIATSF